ncbi:hypothetical protein BGZ70_010586 [Mortierella alpina]|uniref:Uncharacterized protein n=1 Tax=Mortierella alpina TaxID=64518 RepID=A0A9P6IYW1_MORAP|nr:hypothetical protein BGZ70_010586 [Mortierella alpina]
MSLDQDYYFLSSECLLRYGHYARTLRATWLTTAELFRLCQYCPHLSAISIEGHGFSLKFLRHLLCAAPGLTKLDLDCFLTNDFTDDYETSAWSGTIKDKDTNTDVDRDGGSETCNVLNTIERWASPHLEYLVLRPRPSIKVLEKDLRSLFRSRTCLRTVKLNEIDVKEEAVRRRKRRTRRKGNVKERDPDAAQPTMEGSLLGSRRAAVPSSLSPSVCTSLSEADSVTSLEQQHVDDIVRLEFLALDSSTITTLANLLQGCSHLRVLHLHRCDYLKDAALEAIAQHAPSIMSIALTKSRRLTAAGLGQFLKTKTSTRLEHIHFQDLPALDDDNLRILATHHGQKYLELYGHFSRPVRYDGASLNPLPAPDPFVNLRTRIMTLSRLRELRLSATDMGKNLLEGFGDDLRIERLGLYDMLQSETFSLEWATLPMRFPHLKKLFCVFWCKQEHFRALLAPINVEVSRSNRLPKLASDNDFDEPSYNDIY